jgi:RND family efflux transporter MFP subunit
MKNKTFWPQLVLFILILAGGLFGMKALIASKKAPEPLEQRPQGALVEVIPLQRQAHTVELLGHGTVVAQQSSELIPRVSAPVLWLAEPCFSGGVFAQGELIAELDATDYQILEEKAQAQVIKARSELLTIESKALIAQQEWQLMHGSETPPNPLVLYEPQLAAAQASLAAAQAEVKQQQLNQERCRLTAPFNLMLIQERLELGKMVMSGQSVATIRGTDYAEVVVPISQEDLQWVLWSEEDAKKTPIDLDFSLKEQNLQWKGFIHRLLGEVDPRGRMAQLVIRVEDPYQIKNNRINHEGVLMEGMMVRAHLPGKTVEQVFAIPSEAIRESQSVWLMNEQQQLVVHPIRIIRRNESFVLADGALDDGDLLITTYLPGAAPGMSLEATKE